MEYTDSLGHRQSRKHDRCTINTMPNIQGFMQNKLPSTAFFAAWPKHDYCSSNSRTIVDVPRSPELAVHVHVDSGGVVWDHLGDGGVSPPAVLQLTRGKDATLKRIRISHHFATGVVLYQGFSIGFLPAAIAPIPSFPLRPRQRKMRAF